MLQSFFRKQEQESWFKEQSKFVEVLCYQCEVIVFVKESNLDDCPQLQKRAICEKCFTAKYNAKVLKGFQMMFTFDYCINNGLDKMKSLKDKERKFHATMCSNASSSFIQQQMAEYDEYINALLFLKIDIHECHQCHKIVPKKEFFNHTNIHNKELEHRFYVDKMFELLYKTVESWESYFGEPRKPWVDGLNF